ncbi:uncharacterized protein LOC106648315 [Trichogramma pretiosum]|uniref:uncharacterized protein LOC106648315 n=1 Tax=Trichogramma pretiosum TaxID=7493 RepID=UPI0006C97B8D|nr:uncharacterized protein LOC106648315 [Trichogramma pretiosum]
MSPKNILITFIIFLCCLRLVRSHSYYYSNGQLYQDLGSGQWYQLYDVYEAPHHKKNKNVVISGCSHCDFDSDESKESSEETKTITKSQWKVIQEALDKGCDFDIDYGKIKIDCHKSKKKSKKNKKFYFEIE